MRFVCGYGQAYCVSGVVVTSLVYCMGLVGGCLLWLGVASRFVRLFYVFWVWFECAY